MEKGEGKEKEEQKSDVAFSLPPPALFYSFFWERRIERREFEREREMREVSRERDREDNDEEEKRGRKEKVFLLFGCCLRLFLFFFTRYPSNTFISPRFSPPSSIARFSCLFVTRRKVFSVWGVQKKIKNINQRGESSEKKKISGREKELE